MVGRVGFWTFAMSLFSPATCRRGQGRNKLLDIITVLRYLYSPHEILVSFSLTFCAALSSTFNLPNAESFSLSVDYCEIHRLSTGYSCSVLRPTKPSRSSSMSIFLTQQFSIIRFPFNLSQKWLAISHPSMQPLQHEHNLKRG